MKNLIENFASQLSEAQNIGEAYHFSTSKRKFSNVLICGLGGSGIGGSFIKDATINEINIPLNLVKGYTLPNYVNEDTLVIISSYSGNTEEVVACFHQAIERKATISALSSNGEVLRICKERNFDCIQIPGGHPPRACFAYSFVQLFYILHHFDLISDQFKKDIQASVERINKEQTAIKLEANKLAEKIFDKIPVLYSSDEMESVTVRWRQQFNENGKQLCWHHVIPEMNHNELVGWRDKNEDLAVIYLRNKDDFDKIQKRMDLNREVIKKCTSSVF